MQEILLDKGETYEHNDELGLSNIKIVKIAVSKNPIYKKKNLAKLLSFVECINFGAGLYFFSYHISNPTSPKSLLYKVF